YLPLILDPEYHYEAVNVETQRSNTSSLFWYMKRIMAVRKKFKSFGRGNLKIMSVENPKVLAFTRCYEEETLLIVVNLSKFSQAAEVDLCAYKGSIPVDVFSKNRFPVIREDGKYFFTLAPYSFQWFILEKAHPDMDEDKPLPLLLIRHWDGLLETTRKQLESSILLRYLQKARWFISKARNVYQVTITDFQKFAIDEGGTGTNGSADTNRSAAALPVFWLLLEIAGDDGVPGFYQLPLWLIKDDAARKLAENYPEALIAKVRSEEGEGTLVDAFFTLEWQMTLLHKMAAAHKSGHSMPHIDFEGNGRVKNYLVERKEMVPKIHTSDRYNTSITYGAVLFLKMYRKVDRSMHPDQEITRFLSKQGQFPYVPSFI
ncbi:MAG TPA: alpha-glucosidase C-terminal domain-containing protein, partial [Puia sp.]|nr:alpha-glucosidase C-terminal domain-containing protein [Puia sp.]